MFYIDTSDKRNQVLKELLIERGKKVFDFNWDTEIPKDSICVFAPSKKLTKDEAENLPDNVTLFAGNLSTEIVDIFQTKNIDYKNIMQDELFTIQNANLTCEGVLSLILENSEKSIFENNILILGGGRIGKGLCILFNKLGLNYSLVGYHKEKIPEYYLYSKNNYVGAEFVPELARFDVIVNTIPAPIITKDIAQKIAPKTLFVETASQNCLDKNYAEHFDYLLAPALPQKFCAQTAGKLLLENILRRIYI